MNNNSSQKAFKYWLMALLIPILAWAYLNRIWSGRFFLGADNTDLFYPLIYHFKNILTGVFPLWDPFKSWGCLDYIETQHLGVCNPISMIIPVLLFLGVKPYYAYASYMLLCWLMSFGGFFFLINRIYKDPRIAWGATSLLMFTAGLSVFFSWDILGLYIFAPLGWFFGFLTGFVRATDDSALKRNIFGLCLSCMFIVHLYIPFYFLTFFLAFLVSVLLFAGGWIVQFLGACKKSMARMPLSLVFCLVSFLCVLWPTVDSYIKLKDPQNITKFYRGENEDKTGNPIVISRQMIDIGGLASRATWTELFSSYETGDQYLSYAPIMLFILALLTLFNPSSQRQRVVFMTGFLLLLIALTNACPLQHFLYQHVFLFRIFRNYFFFWILFWSACVIFVMGELKQFLDNGLTSFKDKILYAFWVCLVHAGGAVYLMSIEDVPGVSYLTLMTSGLWFLGRLFKPLRYRQGLFIVGLVFIGLWQPFYVLPLIRGVDHGTLDYEGRPEAFSYSRPLFGSGYNEESSFTHRKKYFQDESGFTGSGYIGQTGSYLLLQNLSRENLGGYVRYKFILYGRTSYMPANGIDWKRVEKTITFKDNSALIEDQRGVSSGDEKPACLPVILTGPGPDFKVIHFDVNSISILVRLDQRKFLVYNDSFHSGWHALVDHRTAQLYRANIAFKGIWVEKGRHLIEFHFGSWLDYLRGWGVSVLFMFWFILVIVAFTSSKRKENAAI